MQQLRLGPYEVGKPLGKGGMGSVYEAVDSQTGQRVAVKVLSANLAAAEGFRERFASEIESLKTLRHEGIVRLFGYGEQDGSLFYSMELVDGTSLEEELQRGRRFDWREVTRIGIQLCRALKHAHDHGVIHRDLKPANVLIDADDRVKLADFGIARLFGNNQLTSAGGVLGTADYMAPEQADGRPITDRCDQYSLGGVMYVLLAGRPPFRAKSLPEMLQLQRYAQPEPVRRYAGDAPAELERVIMQLLSKDPADRFPNTLVLGRHLEAMLRALSRPTVDGLTPSDGQTQIESPLVDSQDEGPRIDVTLSPEELLEKHAANGALVEERSAIDADERLDDGKSAVATPPASETEESADLVGATSGTARFTTVEEDHALRERQRDYASRFAMLAQLLGLLAVLGSLGAVTYYLTRPPSADALFARIEAQADSDVPDSLRTVEGEIEEFLARFPEDPRAGTIQVYQDEIALGKLERQFELLLRRGHRAEQMLLPVERSYLQAMNLATVEPQRAADMLRSLIALYGVGQPGTVESVAAMSGADDRAARETICVLLAERQLARLQDEMSRYLAEQAEDLQRHLEQARQLEASNPDAARDAYRAIVELYGESPWAADAVAEARERLSGD